MKKVFLFLVFIVVIGASLTLRKAPQATSSERAPFAGRSSRLAELLSSDDREGYASASEPRSFSFPADHGPHPDFRNEWWYLTGNLDGQGGERFGFELTIFRFAVAPAIEYSSNWRSKQIYIGHFAITDVANAQFHVAERFSRGSMGLAGAQAEPFRVWIEDWSVAADAESAATWRMRATDKAVSVDLALTAMKPPVLNGQNGLSQKSAERGNASYYYSISRLQTEGTLQIGARQFRVAGQAWLDREWGSNGLSKEQAGWDWFALQLDDGSELMYYRLRRLDGAPDPYSAGTWIDSAGEGFYLGSDQVDIVIADYWDNALGDRYPMAWRISVPWLDLQLEVTPVMLAQELSTTVRYWEGAVDVAATKDGVELDGRGYVELTGYSGMRRSGRSEQQ